MAGFNLGDILVNIKANTDGLKKGLGDVQDMGEQTKSMGEKIQHGMNVAAVGLGVVGAGLTLFAKNATDRTVEMVGNAKALGREIGVSTEEASRLSAALGRMGIDADKASSLFGIFSKKIKESTDAADQSTTALGSYGIGVKNADGSQKTFNQILDETADKFKAMPDGPLKTAAAMDLFGKSGKEMLKVLNLGSDGISDLEKEADKLGLTLTSETIGAVSDLVKANKDLKQSNDAIAIAVGTAAAPLQTEFKTALNDVLTTLLNMDGPVRDVTVGFLAFGGPVASGAAALLGFLANAADALPVLGKMANFLKLTAAAQWILNAAMWASPYVLIAVAVAAVGAAIYYALTHMQELGAFMVGLADWFTQGWHPAILAAIAVFMPFIGIPLLIVAYWGPISDFFVGLWQGIQNIFAGVINWVAANWPWLLGALAGPFGLAAVWIAQHLDEIIGFIQSIPGRITGALGDLGNLLLNAGKAVIDGFLNGIKGGFNKVKDFVLGIGNWIKDHKGPLEYDQKLLVPAGGAIMKGFREGLQKEWGNVQDFIGGLGADISGTIMPGPMAMAGAGAGSSVSNNSNKTVIGTINIGSQSDADYLLNRIDRNAHLDSIGISPINPPGAP